MDTIYHKLIQSEQELRQQDTTLNMIGRQLLLHINKLNTNAWYTEFSPKDFFAAQGDKQAQSYMKTSNMIFLLAIISPGLVSNIMWPKNTCVISNDGFVIPTNQSFPQVTVEDILQQKQSYITAVDKQQQEALVTQINATVQVASDPEP